MTTAKKLPLGAAMKKNRNQYLMVAPFAIVFILFTVLPVAAAIFLSFTSFNMTSLPDWVGLENYVTLIVEDDVFLTAIKNTAFFGCHSLASVVIPAGVTSIGDQAFHSCTNLSKVTIPASVTSIGNGAFDQTAYYNDVNNWDNHLLYIGDCLVAGRKDDLAGSVVINEGTRLIADYAFFGNQFTAVSIPASVTVVGKQAFAECAKLADVYYGGKQADWEALTVGEGNDVLGKAKMHYEEVLEKPNPQASSDTTPPADEKGADLWLWVSVISGVVAVVTGVMMFLPKKKEQPAVDAEEPAETK